MLINVMNHSVGLKSIFLLFVAFLVYSTTGVFSKITSFEEFLSFRYFFFFSLVVLSIAIYAVLWQIILRNVPLTQAFIFKSITVPFSLLFAYLIVNEDLTWNNLVGAAVIIAGIGLSSRSSYIHVFLSNSRYRYISMFCFSNSFKKEC